MGLTNVKKIVELNSAHNVNGYLEAGWILLNTAPMNDGESTWIRYCFGWTKELPAIEPE